MKFSNNVATIAMVAIFSLLNACGSGSSSAPASQTTTSASLSPDQQIYEHAELHGGTFDIQSYLPYGGGNLVSGTNYFYANSTGGLTTSPLTAGPQSETPITNTLDTALAFPPVAPARYLLAGEVYVRSGSALRLISYVGSGVHVEYLADDGSTVVTSAQFFNFSEIPLTGIMENAPEELQANDQIDDWINANNFSAGALWQTGAAYTKRQGSRVGDTYIAQDCRNTANFISTMGVATTPCQSQTTLDNFFPITLLVNSTHPYETDFSADGTISNVNGVRMWVANAPVSTVTETVASYRIYYELNGNVYMGLLQKDGTAFKYQQADGSVVNYYIGLNQAAVNSFQQGLITGASIVGSQAGSPNEVGTIDLFGIGGHGINGALAPIDLLTQYNVPSGLDGTGQTIAIVDGPSSGNVIDDLNVYSTYYNLPQCNSTNGCFQHIDLSYGLPVASGSDWGAEPELDTQMVHALAPNAHIILVTARSSSQSDVFAAMNYAASLPGVTSVSMSFTFNPASSEAQAEDIFLASFQSNNGLIFFASSGDSGYFRTNSIYYPAASPYVTAVGGTRINSVAWNGNAQSEVAWQFSGGGTSAYAAMPSWQVAYLGGITTLANGDVRAVPDVAAVADFQHSAVSVYYKQHWVMTGGTSASSPIWAGISALFGQYLANKGASLPALVKSTQGGFNGLLYQNKVAQGVNSGFNDILSGSNYLGIAGPCSLCIAGPGYDNVTGLGAPNTINLFAKF